MASHGRTTSVIIKFAKPGTQPPVYVAGSFSHPEWDPQEMQYTTSDDGEHEYAKEVSVEEGKQYQYKFRMGPGDWWILNEEAPTGTFPFARNWQAVNNIAALTSFSLGQRTILTKIRV